MRTIPIHIGDLVPSVGNIGGRVKMGVLPPGRYREIDPIGGSAARAVTGVVLVIPEKQPDYDEDGAWYHVPERAVRQILDRLRYPVDGPRSELISRPGFGEAAGC